jgi:hypothetical protein
MKFKVLKMPKNSYQLDFLGNANANSFTRFSRFAESRITPIKKIPETL